VLAGRVVDVELRPANHLQRVVELLRLSSVGDVAGMDHECGVAGHRQNLVDRGVEG
jgi:hypothetical protein